MKKLFAGLTASALIFAGSAYLPAVINDFNTVIYASAAEAADFTEGAFGCRITDDGVMIVSYSGTDTVLTLPASLNGMKVTSIGSYCFEFNRTLQHITVSDSITTLCDHAFFGCRELISVDIPSSVKTIENSCFWGCPKLREVHVPDSVEEFDTLVFSNCDSLTDVTLPTGLKVLPDYTFNNCRSLTKLTIPDGVTEIRRMCFAGCTSLKTLTIPQNAAIYDNAVGFYTEDNEYRHIDGFTMYVYPDSPAESYAIKFEVPYRYVGQAYDGIPGDVNGDGSITVTDASLVAACIKNKKPLSDDALNRADTDRDLAVTVTDLSKIAAHIKCIESL